ncbi:hypothetical protein AVEN_96570-1 [Araneus ventricosus]|uniref:Uncharacterized protein n=1 Tax=Araneus ventricosus TaxID=182803 RepID=A0A4Y2H8H2_ARAVE|nr:hypothetical protein AVEN_96570-1 [Araneus ventricosus]
MIAPGNINTDRMVYYNRELFEGLGNMTEALLFIHAFMGCDKTSALYRKGKISGFKKKQNDHEMQKVVDIFNISNASQDSVAATGKQIIVHFYGGKRSDGLDKNQIQEIYPDRW